MEPVPCSSKATEGADALSAVYLTRAVAFLTNQLHIDAMDLMTILFPSLTPDTLPANQS